MIVFQCATPFEIEAMRRAFESKLGKVLSDRAGKRQFCAAGDYVAFRGAVGKVWAAASCEFAITRWSPDLVVDFGAAGALNAGLSVGDILLADRIIEHDVVSASGAPPEIRLNPHGFSPECPVYPEFAKRSDGRRLTRGALAAGDRDIQTLDERRALALQSGAIAVTWESSAVARVCGFHGVPVLSVRVITDVGKDEFLAEYKKNAPNVLQAAAELALELTSE